MATDKTAGHVWVGRCGCYSDRQKPSLKPWFYKPQWYWFGWRTLLPISLGNDEWCRRDLVIGVTVTGRIIIPLWGHKATDCEDCPREEPNRIDDYLVAFEEIHREQKALRMRAKRIKKAKKSAVV